MRLEPWYDLFNCVEICDWECFPNEEVEIIGPKPNFRKNQTIASNQIFSRNMVGSWVLEFSFAFSILIRVYFHKRFALLFFASTYLKEMMGISFNYWFDNVYLISLNGYQFSKYMKLRGPYQNVWVVGNHCIFTCLHTKVLKSHSNCTMKHYSL